MMNKKGISIVLTFVVFAILLLISFSNREVNAANEIAEDASKLIGNTIVEKITLTAHAKGETTTYLRDKKNLREKTVTFSNGKLVNEIIVTESGSRVVSIGVENGETLAYTWKLPNKIADENKNNLQKSILGELKEKLQNAHWKSEGTALVKDVMLNKISRDSGGQREVFFVNQDTGYPNKLETYDIKTNELISTEEYVFLNSVEDYEFIEKSVQAKEIDAPVVSNAVGDKG